MVKQFKELIRFCLVGGLAVGTDFIVYFLLTFFLPGVSTIPLKAFSYISGNVVSFLGQRVWVYNSRDSRTLSQIGPFVIIYGSTLIINNVVNQLILNSTGNKLLAWFIAIVIAVTLNYLGTKFWVFRKAPLEI